MTSQFKYAGARALVLMHEREMREFLEVWRAFKASGVALPKTEDRAYASPEMLLSHILAAARGYMVWVCEQVGFPDPEIRKRPDVDLVEQEAEDYLEHVLQRWRVSLLDLTEEAADGTAYMSRWGVPFSIDAMLEHAVMHPKRHAFQLRELMASKG